jgi:hypothetical protein
MEKRAPNETTPTRVHMRQTMSGRVQSGVCVVPSRRNRLSACRPARVIVKAASEYKTWEAPPRARPRNQYLLTSQLPTQPPPLFIVTRPISSKSPASALSPHTTNQHASQEVHRRCREEVVGACERKQPCQLPWCVFFASLTCDIACEHVPFSMAAS